MGAIVKGIFIGLGIGVIVGGIMAEVFSVDGGGIVVLFMLASIIYSVVKTKRDNEEAEEEYFENIRITNEKRKQEEKRRADEETRTRREAAREEWKKDEIVKLKLMFDECKDVTGLIEQSQFKNELMSVLENNVTEYEKLYFEILKYPETVLQRPIKGEIWDPQTALYIISAILFQNTTYWKDKNEEWKRRLDYIGKYRYTYNKVSVILFEEKYGIANKEKISRLNGYDLKEYARLFDEWYAKGDMEKILNFEYMFEAMWKFALAKPCDLDRFNLVSNIIKNYLYSLENIENGKQQLLPLDVILAELYVGKDFGKKVLQEKKSLMDAWIDCYIGSCVHVVQNLKINQYEIGPCIELASGLKWMGLYDFEAEILRKIVTVGLPLSDELQERLRFIENVGNDLKKVYDVEENASYLSLDYATLNWQEEDFIKLFQTLAFEGKRLKYALTMREWSKNILMEDKTGLDLDEAFLAVKLVIKDEYITSVKCRMTEVQLLSEDGSGTRKNALLITPDKKQVGFGYIGLLLNVIGFGRNINLRIYTMFLPEDVEPETQKQQVLTLNKNTNPDIVAFESGLQTSILKGMETYMNNAHIVAEKETSDADIDIISRLEHKEEQLY